MSYYSIRRKARSLLSASVLIMFSSIASVHGIEVEESLQLKIRPEAAWALIGEFNGLDRWHPAVATSELMGTGKNIGDLRVLTLDNDATITERLTAYDETAMSYEYVILDSPLPVQKYRASITIKPSGNSASSLTWRSSFVAEDSSDKQAEDIIRGIYKSGFESLHDLFN